jgi:phospholipase C
MAQHRRGFSRRDFLRQSTFGAGGLAIGGAAFAQEGQMRKSPPGVPSPDQSGIDHVVVLMMENRSFDHFLGWVPGADGRQAGLSYFDANGVAHVTYDLAPDYQGCGHPDPDHSYDGGRIQLNGGLCDGWLRSGASDEYAIGYYTEDALPFFSGAAQDWTICDHYFSSIMAATYPNRFYMHAAQTDRLDNSFALTTLPTIWDRLADAGLDARYYFSDVPFLAFWGPKYLPISRPFAAFLSDCRAGTLPRFSIVEPRFLGEESGVSSDDHPHADIRNGQAFINQVYEAVVNGPRFRQTLFVITYDEWGGFFDHVVPPTGPIPLADQLAGNTDGLLGFRVPTIVVSPYAFRNDVSHAVLDHTSILRFVEWRWDLPPLTSRDATATNMAEILDFKNARPRRPLYDVPNAQIPTPCIDGVDKWSTLESIARISGWLP